MSDYSEKQMLMLSSFVYLPCSVTDKSIGEILDCYRDVNGGFTTESVAGATCFSGFMGTEDVVNLFTQMDEEAKKDPGFGKLSAARKLNDGNVRAICYTDALDDNALVVFRGTGATNEAWTDNFEGGFETDTKMQTLAYDFVRNECGIYENITVTGHSKGGNMSQYVTVMCGGMVAKCVSFDGQGFNEEFIRNNKQKVDVASKKIKSVAAYNDFVNILLTPIAGEIMYVANGKSIADAHSSMSLLLNNQYDDWGNIISGKNQSLSMRALNSFADNLVSKLDPFDTGYKSIMSYITGHTIVNAMNISSMDDVVKSFERISGEVSTMLLSQMLQSRNEIFEQRRLSVTSVYIEAGQFEHFISRMEEVKHDLNELLLRIDEVSQMLAYNITSKIYATRKLERCCENIREHINSIDRLNGCLDEIHIRYEEKEKTLTDLFLSP